MNPSTWPHWGIGGYMFHRIVPPQVSCPMPLCVVEEGVHIGGRFLSANDAWAVNKFSPACDVMPIYECCGNFPCVCHRIPWTQSEGRSRLRKHLDLQVRIITLRGLPVHRLLHQLCCRRRLWISCSSWNGFGVGAGLSGGPRWEGKRRCSAAGERRWQHNAEHDRGGGRRRFVHGRHGNRAILERKWWMCWIGDWGGGPLFLVVAACWVVGLRTVLMSCFYLGATHFESHLPTRLDALPWLESTSNRTNSNQKVLSEDFVLGGCTLAYKIYTKWEMWVRPNHLGHTEFILVVPFMHAVVWLRCWMRTL